MPAAADWRDARLNQTQFRRMHARENPLNARGFQSEHTLEQACEHRAVVGQNRIIPVLKEICLIDLDLFAKDATAIDAAAHHPVDAAVAMVGPAVAVLPEGTAEFGDHDDHRIPPSPGPISSEKPASARPSSPRRSAR